MPSRVNFNTPLTRSTGKMSRPHCPVSVRGDALLLCYKEAESVRTGRDCPDFLVICYGTAERALLLVKCCYGTAERAYYF